MTVQTIFNTINDTIEFFVDNVFIGLISSIFDSRNKLLLVSVVILFMLSVAAFVIYEFIYTLDDLEYNLLSASEKKYKMKMEKQRKELNNNIIPTKVSNGYVKTDFGSYHKPSYDIEKAKRDLETREIKFKKNTKSPHNKDN